jgi:hypothetical protein
VVRQPQRQSKMTVVSDEGKEQQIDGVMEKE